MAPRFKRRRPPDDEDGPPPEWAASMIAEGELGPWTKSQRPEFWHASAEAQQWFLRIDKDEADLLRGAAKFISTARLVRKWAAWVFWAFTGGLSAALVAGKNLQELPGMISGVISTLRGLF